MDNKHGNGKNGHSHHHHILPTKVAITIGCTLLFLTAVTVWVAQIDLGPLNFVVAMFVATVKALLVTMFFMNLLYDRRENSVIFAASFLFLAIFMTLTSTDIFFRGATYVKYGTPLMAEAKSKLKDPWISTPELIAKGREQFVANGCVLCHGNEGHGDGMGGQSLNPRPRNFTQAEGWKNGRRAAMVFKTLKEGLPPSAMASYSTLPTDVRWELAHYVLSLGPQPVAKDTAADYLAAGVDISGKGGEEKEGPTISVHLAMEHMAMAEVPAKTPDQMHMPEMTDSAMENEGTGARVFRTSCASCHGPHGEGMVVKNVGERPRILVQTRPFSAKLEGLASAEAFDHVVTRGIPGSLMPGNGSLTGEELRALYAYVKK